MQHAESTQTRERDDELRRAYALWAPVYRAAPHNPLMHAEQRVMETLLARVTWQSALDVGTGTGRYLSRLARHSGRLAIGVDFSIDMLAHGVPGTRRVCGQATRLPFPDASFDLVLASLMVGDILDLDGWAAEMTRVLRRGGRLLYSDFHEDWAARGWERTVETPGGRRITLPYWAHAASDHHWALHRAGLAIESACEVCLEDADGPGAQAFCARWGRLPVAVVRLAVRGHGRKPHDAR